MTPRELQRIFQKGECLSLDTMRLYQQGKLSAKSVHEVEKHLLACNLCTAAVDGLNPRRSKDIEKVSGRVQRRLAVYMNTPPRVSFLKRFGLALTAGVVLLVLGGGGVWWWMSHERQPNTAPQRNDTAQHTPPTIPGQSETEAATPSVSTQQRPEQPAELISIAPGPTSEVAEPVKYSLPTTSGERSASPPEQTSPVSAAEPKFIPEQPGAAPASTRLPANTPLRVKSVTCYGKTTHVEPGSNRNSGGSSGQLGSARERKTDGFLLEEMPQFPGGDEALRNYFLTHLKPVAANRDVLKRLATGLSFVVNAKTGEVSAPELSFSISPEVDAEILRVVREMPRWVAGSKRGEIDVRIGITFE